MENSDELSRHELLALKEVLLKGRMTDRTLAMQLLNDGLIIGSSIGYLKLTDKGRRMLVRGSPVATSDRTHKNFDESGIMQRLLLYRAYNDEGPWDVISVSPEAFLTFLEVWAVFLSRRMTSELLAESEAA